MLNGNGGKVLLHKERNCNDCQCLSQMSQVVRVLEQSMMAIIGLNQTVSKIDFTEDKESINIILKKADSLITTNYYLYLPSQKQVVQVSTSEPQEVIKKNIIRRKRIVEPVQLGSHHRTFCKGKNCGLHENKLCEFKHLKAEPSNCTSLADRMTGKGNKFSCYVSAFANYSGGHIYYGIGDDVVVNGEFIPNEKDKEKITKQVEKFINKMIWPERIGLPKRGKQWEIFFEPVADANSIPVPSTFVIVIYIAPCLGGVFTEQPESYEMVEGKVRKMSFDSWMKRILQPAGVHSKEIVPYSGQRTAWSSAAARNDFIVGSEILRKLINDGKWKVIVKKCQGFQSQSNHIKLVILSKQITMSYRKGDFKDAQAFLNTYMTILPRVKDNLIFEVMGLHLQAALKRASEDFPALVEIVKEALSKAELIEPGLVTTAVYAFVATVSDLMSITDKTNESSSAIFSNKSLEHLLHVKDCPHFCADKKQKAHMMLASYYLGCNLNGQLINDDISPSDLDRAKDSIMAVHKSTYEEHPLSKYREVQFKLVQSIYNHRRSQVSPDDRVSLLRSAFNDAKDAERLSNEHGFTEMLEWSKANEALRTEELVRADIEHHPRD